MVLAPSCHSATHGTCMPRKRRAIVDVDALKRRNIQTFILTHQDADIAKQALGGFVQNVADFVLKVLSRDWEERVFNPTHNSGVGLTYLTGLTTQTSSCLYTLLSRRMHQPRSNSSQKSSTNNKDSYDLVWYPRQ